MSQTLLLIDGSNYLFRAFHALPDLRTSAGEPTGAIKGFVSMLGAVRAIVKPDFGVCVFDAKGKTFRSDIYPEYKAISRARSVRFRSLSWRWAGSSSFRKALRQMM